MEWIWYIIASLGAGVGTGVGTGVGAGVGSGVAFVNRRDNPGIGMDGICTFSGEIRQMEKNRASKT